MAAPRVGALLAGFQPEGAVQQAQVPRHCLGHSVPYRVAHIDESWPACAPDPPLLGLAVHLASVDVPYVFTAALAVLPTGLVRHQIFDAEQDPWSEACHYRDCQHGLGIIPSRLQWEGGIRNGWSYMPEGGLTAYAVASSQKP